MKLHTAKSRLEEITGLIAFDVNHGIEITVLGDQSEMIKPTAEKLTAAGVPFRKKPKGKKFAGACFFIPLKNVGTAFAADWEFDDTAIK